MEQFMSCPCGSDLTFEKCCQASSNRVNCSYALPIAKCTSLFLLFRATAFNRARSGSSLAVNLWASARRAKAAVDQAPQAVVPQLAERINHIGGASATDFTIINQQERELHAGQLKHLQSLRYCCHWHGPMDRFTSWQKIEDKELMTEDRLQKSDVGYQIPYESWLMATVLV